GPEIRAGVSYSACLNAAYSAPGHDTTPPGPQPAGERASREEQFLAGIISQQALTDWIRLDPAILTTPGYSTIYQAAILADRLGEPADDLILAWHTATI